jgi:hypothetical protein
MELFTMVGMPRCAVRQSLGGTAYRRPKYRPPRPIFGRDAALKVKGSVLIIYTSRATD